MVLTHQLVWNIQLNPGVQVELWQEFQESVVQVPTELVKVLSVINVEKEECSLH